MARKKAAGTPETKRTAKRPGGKSSGRPPAKRGTARRRHHRRPLGQRLLRLVRRLPLGLRGLSLLALAGLVAVLWLDGGSERRPGLPEPASGSVAEAPAVPAARPGRPDTRPAQTAALQNDEREAPPLAVLLTRPPAVQPPAPLPSAPAVEAVEPPVPAIMAMPPPPLVAPMPPVPALAPRLAPAHPAEPAPKPAGPDGPATLAIIIDDVGVAPGWARRAVRLPAPVTLAFLPYAEHLDQLTGEARSRGHEIFLHLSMEPEGSADPGPNALLASLGEEEMRRRIVWAIGRVPGAVGANNHMGSKLTADAGAMRIVMDELRHAGLLFVDSMTSARSVAGATAVAYGIPETMRDVFLDNEAEPAAIRRQLEAAVRVARRKGSAVAIGHPYPATMEVLESWLPEAGRRGIKLVTASRMIALRRCAGNGAGCASNVHADARP